MIDLNIIHSDTKVHIVQCKSDYVPQVDTLFWHDRTMYCIDTVVFRNKFDNVDVYVSTNPRKRTKWRS